MLETASGSQPHASSPRASLSQQVFPFCHRLLSPLCPSPAESSFRLLPSSGTLGMLMWLPLLSTRPQVPPQPHISTGTSQIHRVPRDDPFRCWDPKLETHRVTADAFLPTPTSCGFIFRSPRPPLPPAHPGYSHCHLSCSWSPSWHPRTPPHA